MLAPATPGGRLAAEATPGGIPLLATPGGSPGAETPGGSGLTAAPSAPSPGFFGAPGREGPVGTAVYNKQVAHLCLNENWSSWHAFDNAPAPDPYSTGGGGVIPALYSAAASAATVMSGGTDTLTSYPPSAYAMMGTSVIERGLGPSSFRDGRSALRSCDRRSRPLSRPLSLSLPLLLCLPRLRLWLRLRERTRSRRSCAPTKAEPRANS